MRKQQGNFLLLEEQYAIVKLRSHSVFGATVKLLYKSCILDGTIWWLLAPLCCSHGDDK